MNFMLLAAEILIWLGVWIFVENVFVFFNVKLYGRFIFSFGFLLLGYYLYNMYKN